MTWEVLLEGDVLVHDVGCEKILWVFDKLYHPTRRAATLSSNLNLPHIKPQVAAIILKPFVLQIWSGNPANFEVTKTSYSTVWSHTFEGVRRGDLVNEEGTTYTVYGLYPTV